jgi:hypothetical protein
MSLENIYIQGRFLKVIATHAVPRYESGHPLVFVDYVARSYYHSRTGRLLGGTAFLNGSVVCGQKRVRSDSTATTRGKCL